MSVKLSNSEATYFEAMVAGHGEETLQERIDYITISNPTVDPEEIKADEQESYDLAKSVFDKMKPLEHVDYAVNGWGYDQTNYENVTVVGQHRASIILLGQYQVYAISKAKFTAKEAYTSLDRVRSTNWDKAYGSQEMAEQRMINAYTGH